MRLDALGVELLLVLEVDLDLFRETYPIGGGWGPRTLDLHVLQPRYLHLEQPFKSLTFFGPFLFCACCNRLRF